MTLSEFENKRCENLVAQFVERRRPPVHIRAKLDLGFRVQDQTVEIFEIRPQWDDERKIQEYPVAKATFSKHKRNWKIFWQRADLKWHSYQHCPEVASIEDFLTIVQEDTYGCFFG